MAKPTCTFCGQYEGVLMDTNLDDGDTQIVCPNDLLMYVLGMAAAISDGMTAEQAEAYSDSLDAIYAHDPRGPKPPAPAAGRKRRREADLEMAPDDPEPAPDGQIRLLKPCTQCGSETATGDAEKVTCDGCGQVLATADELAG